MTLEERMRFVYLSVVIRLEAEAVKRWFQGRRGWHKNRPLLIEHKRASHE